VRSPASLLIRDHRTVKGLFRKFEKASNKSERQRLGEEIIEELSVHALLEEQLIYPIVRERDARLAESVLEALEEHHAVKLTLAELDKMDTDDERYAAKMHVVKEAIETHIEEEESKLLPRLDSLLDAEEAKAISQQMESLRRTAPNHPHPLAPDTPPGGMVAGIVAKVSDVGKDLVRKVTHKEKAQGHRRVVARARHAR
jgi:DUF438 domain-containing protein